MKNIYLLVNLGAFAIPFIFSFHKKLEFNKQWKYAFPAIVISALPFIIWDIYFTDLGVWGFNPKYLVGLNIVNLPIEEILFFIIIPYCCLFTYHCFSILLNLNYFLKIEKAISLALIIALPIVVIFHYDKLYTTYTFLSLSLLTLILQFYIKVKWLGKFYFTYLILLIPFTIVNGILTGTGIDESIVWYNNNENLGIRLLTIPVEDVFYGILLILLNVTLYNNFKSKRKNSA